jgi:hypothetical protein
MSGLKAMIFGLDCWCTTESLESGQEIEKPALLVREIREGIGE